MVRIFLGKGDVSTKDIGCKTSVGRVLVSVMFREKPFN